MGAFTVVASYYNGRFYEINVLYDALEPMDHVDWLIEQIPINSSDRQIWIQSQRKRLESLTPYAHETEEEIMAEENNCLIPNGGLYEAAYVLDFDNEVFTVHGTIHFSLHHLPLATWKQYVSRSGSAPDYLIRSTMKSSAPLEYVGTVWRLPKVSLDTYELDENYESLHAVETKASDWGVPNWDDLSPSQALSVKLVQAILVDHADVFTNPDVADQRGIHNLCCWQLVSAAAPSLLVCRPRRDKPSRAKFLMLPEIDDPGYTEIARPRYFQGNICPQETREHGLEFRETMREKKRDNWDYICWTLRGCLIVFCPRLDTDEFVKSEVVATVAALNGSPSGKSVGIVYSGKHVMAVAIDGGIVQHTPALPMHDLKLNIQGGALLLVHLLSVQLGNKTFRGLSQRYSPTHSLSGGVFPVEILSEIIHCSDYEVYSQFFQVSRYTRFVCLSYPRVNESILLHAVNGGFMVRDRTTGHQYSAHMRRVRWSMHPYLHNSFHLRQVGFGREDETGDEFMVPIPNRDICRRFTESRRRPDAVSEMNMRMIVVWGEWEIHRGTTRDEAEAATPNCPAYEL
ncbi:hypothetical protein FRC09_004080 [Ceratobasidium sp. 395]|nr:hypothetical protein FRC09_004080 [Ceratobasidium sp. 395]